MYWQAAKNPFAEGSNAAAEVCLYRQLLQICCDVISAFQQTVRRLRMGMMVT